MALRVVVESSKSDVQTQKAGTVAEKESDFGQDPPGWCPCTFPDPLLHHSIPPGWLLPARLVQGSLLPRSPFHCPPPLPLPLGPLLHSTYLGYQITSWVSCLMSPSLTKISMPFGQDHCSLEQSPWVWANSDSEGQGSLQAMGSQRVRHDSVTEQQQLLSVQHSTTTEWLLRESVHEWTKSKS